MTVGWRRAVCGVLGTAVMCMLGSGFACGQSARDASTGTQKPLMAEDVFTNVQVLRGIPVKEFMETMGFFAASLAMTCTSCHTDESAASWPKYADDTPLKQTTRRMLVMVNTINKTNFGGARKVTCYTCHRVNPVPDTVPSLAEQYAAPTEGDPDKVQIIVGSPKTPAVDPILNRYIAALGGAQQLAKLTSFSAKGTYAGFDTDFAETPTDVFAKAPGQRAIIVHLDYGDATTSCDGREAWTSAPETHSPVPVLPLVGQDLEGAKFDAALSFPGQISQVLSNWRTGFPEVTLNDRPAQVIEGTTSGGERIKLYFDKETGLLARQTRYTETVIGVIPMHTDYSDYRDVAGVKIPFTWTVTWVDGQSTVKLTEVHPNVAIDAAKFGKPAPPVANKTMSRGG